MTAFNKDLNPERLLELSGEVSRIATTLARLSSLSGADPDQDKPVPDVAVQTVRNAIHARRLRERFFDPEFFADPAWDMMLDLFEAELSQRRVAISSLCAAAAVPATTALRWLKALSDQGLFIRRNDPFDGRRVYVELSADTSIAMRRYFGELANLHVA
jgi:DNA-binding transcriptional ArsR family regulator